MSDETKPLSAEELRERFAEAHAQLQDLLTVANKRFAASDKRIALLDQALLEACDKIRGQEGQCPHDVGHEKANGACEHDWADWFILEAQRTLDMFQRVADEHKAQQENKPQ